MASSGFKLSGGVVLATAVVLTVVIILPQVEAIRYIVGQTNGWTSNVNFTVWAQGKHFYNVDWLYFVYDRNQLNVLEVNKTDYETCNSDHPIHNWTTGGGRDVVPLNITKDYYFISGKGFCYGGVKLAVHVENPPPPPSSSPHKNAAAIAQPRFPVVGVIMLPQVSAMPPVRHIVGQPNGWASNENFTVWAQGKHFYNGDRLFFVYDRNQMNVLEVNKTDYETCNSDHPIHNWTTGAGRDVVPLNITKDYYFISGKGFCYGGVKLAIHVENPTAPSIILRLVKFWLKELNEWLWIAFGWRFASNRG